MTQDVFVQLLSRRSQLEVRYPSSLLWKMATNLCLNRLRDRRAAPEATEDATLVRLARLEDPDPGRRGPLHAPAPLLPAQDLHPPDRRAALRRRAHPGADRAGGGAVGLGGAQAPPRAARDPAADGGLMTRPDDDARSRVPDFYLERYRLGELPEDERDRVERLLELDPELRGDSGAPGARKRRWRAATPPPSWTSASGAGPGPPGSRGARRHLRGGGPVADARPGRGRGRPRRRAGVIRPPAPDDDDPHQGGRRRAVVFRKTAVRQRAPRAWRRRHAGGPHPRRLSRRGPRLRGHRLHRRQRQRDPAPAPLRGPRHLARGRGNGAAGLLLRARRRPALGALLPRHRDEPFDLEPVREAARGSRPPGSEATAPPCLSARGLEQSVFTLAKEPVS